MRGSTIVHSYDFPWRVAIDRGASYSLVSNSDCEIPDAFYNGPHEQRPAVGDDVEADATTGRILDVAPRRSWIARARSTGEPQIVAANLTAAFVVTSPETREFTPRRIVRYLIALRAGNVDPIVVLNKCDNDCDAGAHVTVLREITGGAPVVPISALEGTNCEALGAYLHPGATVALCGSSGVGKSTLFNRLIGRDAMGTNAMRDDGRGRHTTSFRRLVVLPNGAALVDTPGMRSFTPWAQGVDVDAAFSEISALASACRFTDCKHENEPGCAVRDGASSERLEQWRKLQREMAWIESRDDPFAAQERKRAWKQIHKAARAHRQMST
jgi:ribosome biogenesis GTPase / thiamine phosphate phosphatase